MGLFIAILGVFVVLVILAAVGINGITEKNQAKMADAVAELNKRFGEGDYHTVLPGPRCIGIVWESESLILGDCVDDATAIPLASVRSADIELDGVNVTNSKTTTTTNRGSQLAGGLVGGALLGPAGLVVGGLSGGSTSKGKSVETRNIKTVKLVVRVADRTKPIRTFLFFDQGYGEGHAADGLIMKPVIERANHFHALLTGVIEDRSMPKAVVLP